MIICGLVTILPIMNLLAKSISSPQAVTSGAVGIFPVGFQLQSLQSVLSSMNFIGALKNSVIVTLCGGLRKKLCKQYLTKLDKAKITGISLI